MHSVVSVFLGEEGLISRLRRGLRSFATRTSVALIGVVVVALVGPGSAPSPSVSPANAAPVPSGFQETVAFSGLTNPMVVRFSSDGRVFVAEKSGLIKVFASLQDTTPTVFADLRTNVYNFWDRGLLGMALHPDFPAVPYVYVLYTYDHILGDTSQPPKWGSPDVTSDPCPNPPGALSDGCVVSGRLSRLQASGSVMTGSEQVLVEDWCQQFPSHSVGAVEFGPDGMVYASAGDGASFSYVDYGQTGNPCGDPPNEGGALRAQDLRTSGDPVGLGGSIIRVHPSTGAAAPGNPLSGHADSNARRIIAYGLRNPFRFAFRPGTSEMWIGDVGWGDWEEINRITNPTAGVLNFGWPCYEGPNRQSGYEAVSLPICSGLYSDPNADTKPYFAYHNSNRVVTGESCPTGSSSISGLSFEFAPTGGTFPAQYHGALFFADYSRKCIWAMKRNSAGVPASGLIETFVAGAANPVDLQFGPDGSLYYVDFDGGTIRRVSYGAAPSSSASYQPAAHYGTGTNAHGVAIAHLNGDGKSDLAVASSGSNSVSVLLGNGDGTFGAATSFAVGSQPKSVAAGDFNGDGYVDLVTANQGSNSVSVLIGNGQGMFFPAVHYPVCSAAHEVAIGEFNGDGRPDLAVACWGGSVISVLLGNGNGTFGTATNFAAGSAPHSLVVHDFNRDGRYDLAIANRTSNNISILFGNGNGTFQSPVNYAVGTGPHSIRSGDFNGDGIVDLVTANDGSNNVTVLRGAANGTFGSIASYPTGSVPKGIAVGDFNGDGRLDVVTANTAGRYPTGALNPGGDEVSILLGSGAGALGTPTNFQVGNTPFAVAVGRLDGDGRPDLVTANWFSNDVSVLLSSGTSPPPPPSGTLYLSDLEWVSATNGWGPVERNMSNGEQGAGDGRTITLNGITYEKGLGVHALSDVRFAISGCSRFKSDVGVDDEVGSLGSVTFEVYTDATKVYDSGAMTGSSATKQIDVSIVGASELRLVVTDAGNGIAYDHADWADARIECAEEPPPPPPPSGTQYLSDLEWISATNGWGPVERNMSNGEQAAGDGRTITLDGVTYAKGLGVHALSEVRLAISGCSRFKSDVGVDDEVGSNGSVTFEVYADATKVYDSGTMTGTSATKQVDVSIDGASELRLVVGDGGNGIAYDHADWADARIECGSGGSNQAPVPVISAPASSLTWKVGDSISFSGSASDPEDGTLPASALTWTLIIHHCPSNCHTHTMQSWDGVASGSFDAPDHEYPSHLELRLTATDSQGTSASSSVLLQPQTVVLTLDSSPSGLQLAFNGATAATPFTRTVIIGSNNSVSAPSPQTLGGTSYTFSAWSDGGAQSHNFTAPPSSTTYTATYTAPQTPPQNTSLPTITGHTRVGRLLTASEGAWTGTPPISFAYQWLRCSTTDLSTCNPIAGATASTYVPTTSDVNFRLRVRVTATNAAGSASATSNATSIVKRK